MNFKNSLAASGYILSTIGGGYAVHCYLQDATIGDLLNRLGKVHKTKEDFKKKYDLLKDDQQFKDDIQEIKPISLTSTNGEDWQLLKKWCESKSSLQLTKENKEKYLTKAQKYCLDFVESALISLAQETGLNWRSVKKSVMEKGISEHGQLFVAFEDTNQNKKERQRPIYYCWSTEEKNWKKSEGTNDCRRWLD